MTIGMFTGIIEEKGILRSIRHGSFSAALEIEACKVLEGTAVGDSIATNGVCLTVTSVGKGGFTADVMAQTLRNTSLGNLKPGHEVNLERAMMAGGRFGGHMVSGHVDACGRVVSLHDEDIAVLMTVSIERALMRFIPPKGSVTLDGVSLTVAFTGDDTFTVSLIPHTRHVTALGRLRPGDAVNVEVDMLARYIDCLLGHVAAAPADKGGLTMEFLAENGF